MGMGFKFQIGMGMGWEYSHSQVDEMGGNWYEKYVPAHICS